MNKVVQAIGLSAAEPAHYEVEGLCSLPKSGLHIRPLQLFKEFIQIAEPLVKLEIFPLAAISQWSLPITNDNLEDFQFSFSFQECYSFRVIGTAKQVGLPNELLQDICKLVASYLQDAGRSSFVESTTVGGHGFWPPEPASGDTLEAGYHQRMLELIRDFKPAS